MDEERSEAAWRALVTAALMGTERAPFAPPVAAGKLGAALAAIDPSNPERALLNSAALLVAYRRAGALPSHAEMDLPSQATPDGRPPADARAANALEAVLRNLMPYPQVQEWCALAVQAGVRIPDQFLPAILDLLRSQPTFFELPGGIGARGRWLAAQNPAWRLLALEPGKEADAWATGDRTTRLYALKMARRRDPDAGRALLESTWKAEPAEDRVRFLRELAHGLSLADEPFLESALDDRSRGVRAIALTLLSRIGGSALVARMTARIKPLISFDQTSGRFLVTLPETCDAAMQRDGIEPRPSMADAGEKTGWFAQMLCTVPPRVWVDALDASPQTLIAAAQRSIWKPLLLEGWAGAAVRHADESWLAHVPLENLRNQGMIAAECLSAPTMERLVTRLLQIETPLVDGHPLLSLLQHKTLYFTRSQTRHALQRLRQTSEQARPNAPGVLLPLGVSMLVRNVINSLHPSAVGEVEAAIGVQDGDFSRWGNDVRDALQFLHQRREIYAAFGKL